MATLRRLRQGQIEQGQIEQEAGAQGIAVVGILVAEGDGQRAETTKKRGGRVDEQDPVAPVANTAYHLLARTRRCSVITEQSNAHMV